MSRFCPLPRRALRLAAPLAALLLALGAATAPGQAPATLAQSADERILPGDVVPPFTLTTVAGDTLEIGGAKDAPGAEDMSWVLLFKSPYSAFSTQMWAADVAHVLQYSPPDANWVFASYAETEEARLADLDAIRTRLDAAIAGIDDAGLRGQWSERIHYVIDNPLEVSESMLDHLVDWGSVLADVEADLGDGTVTARGFTDAGWATSLLETGPVTGQAAWFGLACNGETPAQDVTEKIALIERGVCPFADKGRNAEAHGATAALIFTDDRDKVRMAGSGDVGIPAAMIDRQPGLDIRTPLQAGVPVTVTITGLPVGVEAWAINHAGQAREFGTIPFPWGDFGIFRNIGYEAQHMRFEHQRELQLAADEAEYDILELPVYEDVWAEDPGWAGARSYVEVEFPDAETMRAFDTLEVDLTMSCPDNRKANCPAWDYLVHMYLCEKENRNRCGLEIGRWITPYWSGGRWVTDISHVLAYLHEGGARRIGFYTQQRYELDMHLRLSKRGKGAAPREARMMFTGGGFNPRYNEKYRPYTFTVPEWAERVEIVSLITGHGFGDDTENCAEFCNHTHHFTVNGGEEHVKEHPIAGTNFGCADKSGEGVTPNQAGTWIYGRGGWCPGQDVPPWVVDITDEVDMEGGLNTIEYRGLFDGKDPNPIPLPEADRSNFPGRIDMFSYVVFHGRYDSSPDRADLPLSFRGFDPKAELPELTPLVRNPGFERGLADWTTGGDLDSGLEEGEGATPYGKRAMHLGDPTLGKGADGGLSEGTAWVEQRIRVPDTQGARLVFMRRLVTHEPITTGEGDDLEEGDSLDVLVEGERRARIGAPTEHEAGTAFDEGWAETAVNVSAWRGQEITVRFALVQPNDTHNSWAWVDRVGVRP